jgi:hypothetical protein
MEFQLRVCMLCLFYFYEILAFLRQRRWRQKPKLLLCDFSRAALSKNPKHYAKSYTRNTVCVVTELGCFFELLRRVRFCCIFTCPKACVGV